MGVDHLSTQLFNLQRVDVVAELLSKLGFDGIARLDRHEPEYTALKKIFSLNVEPKFLGLIALSAGLIDFQLGYGGAECFWDTLFKIADRTRRLNSLKGVEALMTLFLNEPINAKYREIKRRRLERIFRGGFADWYNISYEGLTKDPWILWSKIANSLGSPMNKKTIVFSMKAFDIANLICYGDYLPLPQDIPIPLDFHVKHVTISAGLLNHYGVDEHFRHVWSLVLNKVKNNLGRNISLLRLDSLVWQIGKILYKCRYEKERSQKNIEEYLTRKINTEKTLAKEIATELTLYIDRVKM